MHRWRLSLCISLSEKANTKELSLVDKTYPQGSGGSYTTYCIDGF